MSLWDYKEQEFYVSVLPQFIDNNVRNNMKDKVFTIRGTLDWAKIVGKARPYTGNPKYDKGPYWSVDITPDAKSLKAIEDAGISKKLRDPTQSKSEKETRKAPYLSLKINEKKPDGDLNSPPNIQDILGGKWPSDTLIGNGSVADILVKVKDYGSGSEMGCYFQKMRVLKHVPFEGGDFEELSEDDEFFGGGTDVTEEDDLSDDVPF